MAWKLEKSTGDLVFNGFEQGIASSPHQGIANMINVNTSTETGEVMCNFSRVQQSQQIVSTGGTVAVNGSNTLNLSTSANTPILAGTWIQIGSGITGLSTGNYYILNSSNTTGFGTTTIQISQYYNSAALTGFVSGTATFTTFVNMGQQIASATEKYTSTTSIFYRYYVLDANGAVWVYDSGLNVSGLSWFLPDVVGTNGTGGITNATGIAVFNGLLWVFAGNMIYFKATVNLGNSTATSTTWNSFAYTTSSPANSPNPHFAYTGHTQALYYTDGSFVGSIVPNNSSNNITNGPAVSIQSYASYTPSGSGSSAIGTIISLIGGVLPGIPNLPNQFIPAIFFPSPGGSVSTALAALSGGSAASSPIVWIKYSFGSATFQVFSTYNGVTAIDINSGSSGTQYFNTIYPLNQANAASLTFSPNALTLAYSEVSQSIIELDTNIIVGGKSNTLYIWNQQPGTLTASDIVVIPENNVVKMVNVNNIIYILAGNKGNIYLTNGSAAVSVLKIPDYCAGLAGTPTSYIEPYFTWGDMMYLRGRVYVGIQDQTSSKTGTCGGIWSFVPTQNYFTQQDQGAGLKMENVNSYASFSNGIYTNNGLCTVLIPNQVQTAISPQYWSAWYSSVSGPLYGIDVTGTAPNPNQVTVIETDVIPTGTFLQKKTFERIEYKVSSPLLSTETVTINYRMNTTDSWSSFSNQFTETNALSGYYNPSGTFQFTQWTQFQIILKGKTSSPSFNRLFELRLH